MWGYIREKVNMKFEGKESWWLVGLWRYGCGGGEQIERGLVVGCVIVGVFEEGWGWGKVATSG